MSSLTPPDRRDRLAAELRANLKRRKVQTRLRQSQEKSPHVSEPCAPPKADKKDQK